MSASTPATRLRTPGQDIPNYAAYSLTPEGLVSSWTDSARRITGYEAEEILGRHFGILHASADLASGLPGALLREAADMGYVMDQGWRVRKDGTQFWAGIVISAVRDHQGRLTGFSKFTHDLSSTLDAQSALRLSEEKFHRVFAETASGMALVSLDGRWLEVNQALCDYLGYTKGELRRLNFQAVTYPEDLGTDLALVKRTLAGEINTFRMEKRYVRKDGEIVWGRLNVSLIRDSRNAPRYFISQIIDITDLKLALERISQLASMVDQANDAIISSDLSGRITYWNSGAARLLGWTSEEVLGKRTEMFMPIEDMPAILAARDGTLADNEWRGELRLHTKQGTPVTVESHQIMLNDPAGRLVGHLTIALDITGKKQAEAQLLRAQRMESVGTLAGGIAHDLNNILAPIMMAVELLRARTNDRPELHTLLDRLNVSARRGASLVRQILTFGRGVSGERDLVHLRHLAREVENLLIETLPKNIEIEVYYPSDLWPVLGDSTQLQQVMLNLCVNARDAMPAGGVITLQLENARIEQQETAMYSDLTPGDYVRLVVSDTGIGMSPELKERIFEPFFTTKELGQGTGLGLSTVLTIVKGHHGVLHVDSTPGRGSSFHVLFPAAASKHEESVTGAPAVSPIRGKGELVLLVDDEPTIIEVYRATLEQFGYRVLTAANGAEAIALYAQYRNAIALVIVDMAMPVMNGRATIHALRSLNPEIKIIGTSGQSAPAESRNPAGIMLQHFLTKPCPAEDLLATVSKVILQRPSAPPFPPAKA